MSIFIEQNNLGLPLDVLEVMSNSCGGVSVIGNSGEIIFTVDHITAAKLGQELTKQSKLHSEKLNKLLFGGV
jgi:hypothetical protein